MNDSKFSKDIQNRDIPINLEISDRVQKIKYTIANIDDWILENRFKVIAELLGMIKNWKDAGAMIQSDATHTLGGNWAPTIDSILRTNGIDGFLENYEESNRAYDADYDLMLEICGSYHEQGPLPPDQWAVLLIDDLLKEKLTDTRGNTKQARTQAQIVGKLFSAYEGERISCEDGDYLIRKVRISSRPLKYEYSFEKCND
jgi:hypothetical protein